MMMKTREKNHDEPVGFGASLFRAVEKDADASAPIAAVYRRVIEELQWVQVAGNGDRAAAGNLEASGGDLVDIKEAASFLSVSKHWLHSHHPGLPFAMKVGGHVRFSKSGMGCYLGRRRAA